MFPDEYCQPLVCIPDDFCINNAKPPPLFEEQWYTNTRNLSMFHISLIPAVQSYVLNMYTTIGLFVLEFTRRAGLPPNGGYLGECPQSPKASIFKDPGNALLRGLRRFAHGPS